jgi:hypothetical protein
MKRSNSRFLVFFLLAVLSGAALILVLPASLGTDPSVQAWIPTACAAVLLVSAVLAWLVRPRWRQG